LAFVANSADPWWKISLQTNWRKAEERPQSFGISDDGV
jgi:hypothetical protein